MSLTVHMVREVGHEIYHIDIGPRGEMKVLEDEGRMLHPRVSRELMAANEERKRGARKEIMTLEEGSDAPGSQLLTIRFLSLAGWRVSDPALWSEEES